MGKQWTNPFLISLFYLNLIPFTIGRLEEKPSAITNPSYELCSWGPATLSTDALDNHSPRSLPAPAPNALHSVAGHLVAAAGRSQVAELGTPY
jgi:hypothetical protein